MSQIAEQVSMAKLYQHPAKYKNVKYKKSTPQSRLHTHQLKSNYGCHTFTASTRRLQNNAVKVVSMIAQDILPLVDGVEYVFKIDELCATHRHLEGLTSIFIHMICTYPLKSCKTIWTALNGYLIDRRRPRLYHSSMFDNFFSSCVKTAKEKRDSNGVSPVREGGVRPKDAFTSHDLAVLVGQRMFDFNLLSHVQLLLLCMIFCGTGARVSAILKTSVEHTGLTYADMFPKVRLGKDLLYYKYRFDKIKTVEPKPGGIPAPLGERNRTSFTNIVFVFCLYAHLCGAFVEPNFYNVIFGRKYQIRPEFQHRLIFVQIDHNQPTKKPLIDSLFRIQLRRLALASGLRALAMMPHMFRRGYLRYLVHRLMMATGMQHTQVASEAVQHLNLKTYGQSYCGNDSRMYSVGLDALLGKSAMESFHDEQQEIVTMTSSQLPLLLRVTDKRQAILHPDFHQFAIKTMTELDMQPHHYRDLMKFVRNFMSSTWLKFIMHVNEETHEKMSEEYGHQFTKPFPRSFPKSPTRETLMEYLEQISKPIYTKRDTLCPVASQRKKVIEEELFQLAKVKMLNDQTGDDCHEGSHEENSQPVAKRPKIDKRPRKFINFTCADCGIKRARVLQMYIDKHNEVDCPGKLKGETDKSITPSSPKPQRNPAIVEETSEEKIERLQNKITALTEHNSSLKLQVSHFEMTECQNCLKTRIQPPKKHY